MLTTANWAAAAARHNHQNPTLQRAKLLSYLKSRTSNLGAAVNLETVDHPLVDALSFDSLLMLLSDLEIRGDIEKRPKAGSYRLTVQGWEKALNASGEQTRAPKTTHSATPIYDVAISFAGAQRQVARDIALELQKSGLNVFLDEFEQGALWGEDLAEKFGEIFFDRSKHCLMLISDDYVNRDWPHFESRHAIARMISERTAYILPVKFDSAVVPGLPTSIHYLKFSDEGVDGICSKLLEKLTPRTELAAVTGKGVTRSSLFPLLIEDLGSFATTLTGEGFDAKPSFFAGQVGLEIGPRGLNQDELRKTNTTGIFLPLWELNHIPNRPLIEARNFHAIVEFRPVDWHYNVPYQR